MFRAFSLSRAALPVVRAPVTLSFALTRTMCTTQVRRTGPATSRSAVPWWPTSRHRHTHVASPPVPAVRRVECGLVVSMTAQ